MPSLSLKIILEDGAVTRVMKFPSGATVADATSMVEEKVLTGGAVKDYGLFLTSADDELSGIWLEDPRRLDYYLLKDGDSLHYRCRVRTLRIRMLDGSLKTMQVDERKPVVDLMLEVCSKLGITNYEEYGLCREDQPMEQEAPATGTLTLKRKAKPREKDAAMQQLSKKLKTDDNVEWLEQRKTLRECSVTPTETLLLKRRLFYSDRKVDARDPVQLNLLYVQARDAVLQGRHPVTEDQDQVCKARWINIRDMMRRKIRERLRNPSHRSYNYKYEEEMSFMIPYFKDASATSEEYTDFIDEDTSCEVAMTSDVFADGLPAVQFAGIQCQVQYGDFQEEKHKPGYIENLSEFLPQQYVNAWGVEKKVLREYSQHTGMSSIEAKHLYTKTARDLPTYGVTFFLVKEMQKGKKKLVPRLLGINANSILRLDETTKEVLQVWPLTQVKTYKAGKGELFTLNFGDYSEKEYCVKTNDAYRIRDILQSYIDLIRKKMAGPYNPQGDEGGVVYSATVESSKGQTMEVVAHSSHKGVETSFVGPSKIISYEQGSNAQAQGAQVMTAQQVIITSRQHNEQTVTTGGVAMRGEMSVNTVRKLNDLNGNAVSIVKLLTDPNEANIEEAKKIIEVISQNMPVLVEGVKQHIEKQPDEPARRKLTFELSELIDNVAQLKQFKTTSDAQEAAMKIADLTTQMYFALDPRSKRKSDWMRRSRQSFIEDDKTQATLHRASFINSVAAANHAIDDAKDILNKEFVGPTLSPQEVEALERAARDRLAKLNAAIALFTAAHADPKNIDYGAAVNSMNTIKELIPELAKDAQCLSGAQDGKDRSALLQDMRELCDAAARICQNTGCDDLQIIRLAKEADDKASLLMATASQLAGEVDDPGSPVAARAAARCGHAARGLRACAQLTAASIHEPHCRSALSASAEDLKSSTKVLTEACRPLLEHPEGRGRSEAIKNQSIDLMKALERLENAYSELDGKSDLDGGQAAERERRRLQFVTTLAKAQDALDSCDKILDDTKMPGSKSDNSSGWYRLAELNAAIASLVAATRDGENPDYASADQALGIIEESLPDLVKDGKYYSQKLPPQQREEFLKELRALCDAARALALDTRHGEEASAAVGEFSRASGKLTYVFDKHALIDKEHQIIDLAKSSCEKTSELLAHVYGLAAEVQGKAADELDAKGSMVAEAAQELLTTAQLTAPTIHTAPCKNALFNSAQDLSSALENVARIWSDACQPHRQAQGQVLAEHKKAADDEIQRLIVALNSIPEYEVPKEDPIKAKKRVQFAMSLSNAHDAVEQAEMDIDKPLSSKPLSAAEVTAARRSLADKLATLNAAIAALMAATQDPSNPNYEVAESSSAVIQQLVPQLVKDTKALCGSTDKAARADLLDELRALCAATKALSTRASDGNTMELNKAVSKYANAARKLSFICTPQTQAQGKQQNVMDKTRAVCDKSTELMAVVRQLNKPGACDSDLQAPSLKVQQAAQALLTTAQLTAPSLHATECRSALHQAAADLFRAMSELENVCGPQLGQAALQSISKQRKAFEDAVEELMRTIKDLEGDTQDVTSQAEEKQRLRFIATQAVLDKAAQELNEPIKSPPLTPPQAKALRSSLSDRLAALNAAIAALVSSTRDESKPDYAAAETATATIQELMPELVKDAKLLGVGMNKADRGGLLESMRALCDATKALSSEHGGKEQELNDAVAQFTKASSQLVYTFNPHADPVKEDLIIDLTKSTCLKTSELLAQVYNLAEQVGGTKGEDLDAKGTKVADAAQNLLTTAEITAPSITSPQCQSSCLAALDALSSAADQLVPAWQPAASPKTAQELETAKAMVDEEVMKLREALMIKEGVSETGATAANAKKERMRFVTSLASTEAAVVAAEKELDKPSGDPLPASAVASMQDSLAQRLAALNAAISALVAATRDYSNPDYAAAESATVVIRELVPDMVKDTKSLSSSKDSGSRNELLAQMRALCEATRRIGAGADQSSPEEINKAAIQFSLASGKLSFVYNPKADQKQAQQIMDTCQSACVKTSEMLRHVRALAGDAGRAGVRLEQRGAAVADAARTLLTTGQLTAHSAHSAPCQAALLNASETLSSSLQDLESVWEPIVQDLKFKASGEQLAKDQEAVEAEIVQLRVLLKSVKDVKGKKPVVPIRSGSLKRRGAGSSSTAVDATKAFLHNLRCEASADGSYEPPMSPRMAARLASEKQARLNFGKCVAGALHTISLAEDDLKKSLSSPSKPRASLDNAQVAALSKQLEHKLARANAAAAHLLACRGSEKPDYQLATKCVGAVSDLMPTIVTDAKTLADLKDVPTRKVFLDDTMALCTASKNLCETAKNDKKKLTEAALLFGNESSKLLYAVSTDVDPSQENQVLLRVKAVGDVACRVTAVADDPAEQDAAVHCAAQATVFMYTAKLVAPSIQDPECQDSLITASKDLSSQLKTIPTTKRPAVAKELTELEKLLEDLRRDVAEGKLVKRREVLTVEDTPLRRLTAQVIEDAKQNAECTSRPAAERRAMADFANQLTDALKMMDLANARCKNAPHDMKKRADLEDAVLNVQQLVLQCRPRPGAVATQSHIVDLAVFLDDVSTAADQLNRAANNAELTGGVHARTAAAVSAQCQKLCGPAFRGPGVDVDHAAKECAGRVQKINTAIECCAEGPEKAALKMEARPLNESCTLLQFASQSSIATSQCAALDEALNDLADLEHRIDRMLQPREGEAHTPQQHRHSLQRSRARLATAAAGARRSAQELAPAFTRYVADARATCRVSDDGSRRRLADHLKKLHDRLKLLTMETGRQVVTWRPENQPEVVAITEDILKELDNAEAVIQGSPSATKSHIAYEDLKKLLLPVDTYKVEGDRKQLEAKLDSSATKLNSMTETITLSVNKPESLARTAHLTAETALQLTAVAKSLKTDEDPTKNNKIEEASQELCFVTYNLLKTAESTCHEPNSFEAKRRLLDACRSLTDAINKLVRTSSGADKLQRDCNELGRSLQLRQSCLQARPTCTLPYTECVAALQTQHGVIENLKSDKPMSRQEFSIALDLLASAVGNNADYAEQCAYLLSISEQHPMLAKEGLFDTARVRRLVDAAEESCFRVTRSAIVHQAKEESSLLSKQLSDLKQAIEECSSRVSDTAAKQQLLEASSKVDSAGVRLQAMLNVDSVSVDKLTPPAFAVIEALSSLRDAAEHPALAPRATPGAPAQQQVDEVINQTRELLSRSSALARVVRAAESQEAMTWVMFNTYTKGVIESSEQLVNCIRNNGQNAGLIEGAIEVDEEADMTTKSYIQTQVLIANKWLHKPTFKSQIKKDGETAARNVIDIGKKMSEHLKETEREEMRHLVEECEQLLAQCSAKYDLEAGSVLMDRLKELAKAVDRCVVTMVVEDLIDDEEPMADLELLIDAERDEAKRKFVLERKIAELLAHLGRVTTTARVVADGNAGDDAHALRQCSDQASLLAPMLVRAAEKRVVQPTEKAVVEEYQSQLAQYAESLTRVRDLCDRAVDPMQFVQTAEETMQRMKEESTGHQNDLEKCSNTSIAIRKLAHRVINVSMSSRNAQRDPELMRALAAAQQRLKDAEPSRALRASKLPDWRNNIAEILRATGEVESVLGGEMIFKKLPEPDQPIYNAARNLHAAVREWSARDNEIVAVAKRMAVLMAKLSDHMHADRKREVISTSKAIVTASHEVARLARKLALECTDMRIRTNLLQVCDQIPTISGQLKMLTTVKGSSLGHQGTEEDIEAMNMLVGNAQNLMMSIQDVVNAAASASVKIRSQRGGPRMRWVRKNYH